MDWHGLTSSGVSGFGRPDDCLERRQRVEITFLPRKDVSSLAHLVAVRGIGPKAHWLIGAHFKREIGDLKPLGRRRIAGKDTHEREMRRRAIPRRCPLHFQKNRMGGPRCDVTPLVVEKGSESRSSARHGQGWLVVLQNVRRQAVLPRGDLLAKSLA